MKVKDISPLAAIFLRVKELEVSGKNIIQLGVGDPFCDTPGIIKKAGINAIRKNITHYIPPSGSEDMRNALAIKYGVKLNQVVFAQGSRIMLSAIIWALVNRGDKVLIPAPYYPSFVDITTAYGGTPILIDTLPNKFQLTLDMIKEAIKKDGGINPKLLIINSPNNPTGAIYHKEELEKIVDFCEKNKIWILSDECYQHFSNNPNFTLLKISKQSQVIIIDSFSKKYAMTGWRAGFGIMASELAQKINYFFSIFVSSNCSVTERAALAALGESGIPDFVEQRKLLSLWLKKMKINCEELSGGFYAFPDISKFINKHGFKGSLDLAEHILNKYSVCIAPGIAFGKDYDEYIRIAYCENLKRLEKALKIIEPIFH